MRCGRCHRSMKGTTAYDGACACGGLIEAGKGITMATQDQDYKVEVGTVSCAPSDWSGNALTFATRKDAIAYAENLCIRWTATTRYRVVHIPTGKVTDTHIY